MFQDWQDLLPFFENKAIEPNGCFQDNESIFENWLKMPAVRGDGMRGLAVFISDIRNCKSKEAEVKRINKELANIRSKFKVGAACNIFTFKSKIV